MQELDCRGLACPQPVLNTKDALEQMEAGQIKVIVDNDAAVGNVTRFATSQGCSVEQQGQAPEFALIITKQGPADGPAPEITCPAPDVSGPRLVVRIAQDVMGQGDDELGRILIKAFIKSMADATIKPKAVVFYNGGVKLAVEGSEHVEAIKALEDQGVDIFACGTCLDFFNLKESLAVGKVTNMFEIIETLSGADRVVSP
jgi:selenium metabolism protein YedF